MAAVGLPARSGDITLTVAIRQASLRPDELPLIGGDGATAAFAVGQTLRVEPGIIGVCPEAAIPAIGNAGPT
ncbi:hypothetical protein CK934_25885 [Chitinophaga sp. MD30]|nr:hypothetical protein CK934_25885 [Chitinophaga sp. MD30]